MKLQHIGLDKADVLCLVNLLDAKATTLRDVNGAPPPELVDDSPNPDYATFDMVTELSFAFMTFHDQVDAYDVANASDTNPAVRVESQAGGY